MSSGIVLFGIILLAGILVQQRLAAVIKKNSQRPLYSGLSGKEIAEKMLYQNGIFDVRVTCVSGELTDHYNPTNKTVNLSQNVYHGKSIASAAIAAHECGHAIQHKMAYPMLEFRNLIVPVVSFTSQWVQWVLLAGILVINSFPALFMIGIAMLAFSVIFSVVTLPVEYNASARALAWLQNSQSITYLEADGAKESLQWAARTYLVAALSSLATLLYYLGFLRND